MCILMYIIRKLKKKSHCWIIEDLCDEKVEIQSLLGAEAGQTCEITNFFHFAALISVLNAKMLQPQPGKVGGRRSVQTDRTVWGSAGVWGGCCHGCSEMDPVSGSQLDLGFHVSCLDSKDPSYNKAIQGFNCLTHETRLEAALQGWRLSSPALKSSQRCSVLTYCDSHSQFNNIYEHMDSRP